MTLRDLIVVSTGNLYRMKLRASLTISGVLIAIAAFVSMLSFGAGNQAYVEKEFTKLGLFTTMQVYPKNEADTGGAPRLDRDAIARLSAIPGVNLVYPYEALAVRVRMGDSSAETKAMALPASALRTKLFSNLIAGGPFSSDTAKEVILRRELAMKLSPLPPESLIGRSIVISVQVSTLDSGFAHLIEHHGETLKDRLKRIRLDSLKYRAYRSRILRTEGKELAGRFLAGFSNAKESIAETLTVRGIREATRAGKIRVEPVIVPTATVSHFTSHGFAGGPAEIFSKLSSGSLFESRAGGGESYSQLTLDFDPRVLASSVKDSVERLGFRAFSFADQFEEIQKFFFYFDLGLGVVGFIALITASLGIINTMVMSINERRKEIGILKSLGADDKDIRSLFLVESGLIGVVGTWGGILFGWGISRTVSGIAKMYMRREGIPEVELFALPFWLILTALAIGVTISMLAGFFPARRGARIDPVAALRNE